MKFERLETRYVVPDMGRKFSLGDVDGQARIIGPIRDMVVLHGFTSNGVEAWSAIDTVKFPIYGSESSTEAWALLQEVGETFIGKDFNSPRDAVHSLGYMINHYIFQAAFANLYLDAEAIEKGVPLYTLLGGEKEQVEIGVSIPKTATAEDIGKKITIEKFKRIKVKVGPTEEDYMKIASIKNSFPNVKLMIDANSSFDIRNNDHIKLLNKYGELDLLMIEQPLAHNDIAKHINLQNSFNQNSIPGNICLDESILTMDDLVMAVDGGIPIINIKVTRVGGLDIAKKMIEYCQNHKVDTWIGGMVELTAPGKAHSLAMAAHPGVTLPSDISGSAGYFIKNNDPYVRPMERENDGAVIKVPNTPGRGWEVDLNKMDKITKSTVVFPK
ncbi:MAG: enolase C-terminal domain-like protein [Candidatus Woesebacteria bacterium]|nr:enolase C-terminal domain-like protein [Candidatus Woesebacteria bacterium]